MTATAVWNSTAVELLALAQFRLAAEPAVAMAAQADQLGELALSQTAFHELVERALGYRLARRIPP